MSDWVSELEEKVRAEEWNKAIDAAIHMLEQMPFNRPNDMWMDKLRSLKREVKP